ncbi:MAG: acylneuraminate cytidylyltransferase family protein [Pirellulales bacterium]|nr:acylneuraminate cytidylyltransferase family protein [Pirellulales bacterium]
MENIVGFIFARGGSKGVPGKNLRPLGGKPLIARAITAGLECRSLERIIVSTDCPRIAQTAREWGAEVPFLRPAELASDTAPERLAWRHAIEQMEKLEGQRVDVLISIPPTCPLRHPEDIDQCVESLLESDADIVLTATESDSNPYFNMITRDEQGVARLAIEPQGSVVRRQDAPQVFQLTAVAYAARRDPVFAYDSIFQSRASAVLIPQERAIDIDSERDLELAEFFLSRREPPTPAHRLVA